MEKMKGWLAFYKNEKVEIKLETDADSLYSAKQYAVKHFKVSKANEWLVALEVAY